MRPNHIGPLMSTPAQKANLARIRDNQRRSRARRREYIAELEQRLRAYELSGVEASSEVQLAARRVAEENRQLRELLHKHGFQDEYVSSFLLQQAGTSSSTDPVQALQQIITPRRPVALESGMPFAMQSQVTREMASGSLSAATAAPWDPQQVAMSPFAHPHVAAQQPVVPPAQHPYASPVFTEGPPASLRSSSFQQMNPSTSLLDDVSQHSGTTQPSVGENPAAMSYIHMNPYQNPSARDYPPGPPPPPTGGGYY
ncbi:hypothetical protein HDV57DRAFT_450438 [Trichoderma longibrachiatum]